MQIKFIVTVFIIWRLLLFAPLYFGQSFLPYRAGYEYTNIWFYFERQFLISHFLLYPWANFDGVHYLSIALNGYTTEARFFPFLPLIIRFVSQLFFANSQSISAYFWTGFLITNPAFFGVLIIFYKLIRLDFADKIAKSSLIFLLIFPTSFFFGSIYTESIFLFLLLISLYYARKKQWLQASLFAALLTITRLNGILILPALVYEFFSQEKILTILSGKRWLDLGRIAKRGLALIIVPLGLLSYTWFNSLKWGDSLYFLKAHTELTNSRMVDAIILFPQTIFRYFKILTRVSSNQYEWWIALLEVATFVFAAYLLYLAWKMRIRPSYLIFALLSFLLPVSSGTFSALPRYILVLFPIFIVLALVKNIWFKLLYSVISVGLAFVLLMLFSRGYFVA